MMMTIKELLRLINKKTSEIIDRSAVQEVLDSFGPVVIGMNVLEERQHGTFYQCFEYKTANLLEKDIDRLVVLPNANRLMLYSGARHILSVVLSFEFKDEDNRIPLRELKNNLQECLDIYRKQQERAIEALGRANEAEEECLKIMDRIKEED